MERRYHSAAQHDALFLILLVVIGASLLLSIVFTRHLEVTRDVSSERRYEIRNELIRSELDRLLLRVRLQISQAAYELTQLPPDDQTEELFLSRLDRTSDAPTLGSWGMYRSRSRSLSHIVDGELAHTPVRSDSAPPFEGLPSGTGGALIVYLAPRSHVQRLCLVFRHELLEENDRLILIADDTAVFGPIVEALASEEYRVTIVDSNGNEVAHISSDTPGTTLRVSGIVEEVPATLQREAGFVDPLAREAYLGAMNQYLWRVDAPTMIRSDASVTSIVPIEPLNVSLIIESSSLVRASGRSIFAIAIAGATLYALIIWLFVGLRRTVFAQTGALRELSEQKNVLFSLLSHNLKNNLAAISAEAYSQPDHERLIVSVDNASRVVSNCLYYLQFQEHRFKAPPLERVTMDEIMEFLAFRVEEHAAFRDQKVITHRNAQGESVLTNLNLILEALERLVVHALKHANKGGDVMVTETVLQGRPTLQIAYEGTSSTDEEMDRMYHPFDAVEGSVPRPGDLAGLELYVARRLLNSLEADVGIVSDADSGQRIVVEFAQTE